MRTSFSTLILVSGLLFGSLPANAQTVLQVCHGGGPRAYAAVYDTYQGLLSGYEVEGWYILEDGGCVREVLWNRYVRAYAFAALTEDGEFVALPFDFNFRGGFGRSTRNICVPVQESLQPFSLSSGEQSGVVAPCPAGHVAIPTSFSIRGGDVHQPIRLSVRVPDTLPSPDPAYARVWSELFGAAAEEREAAEREAKLEAEREAKLEAEREAERLAEERRLAAELRAKERRYSTFIGWAELLAERAQDGQAPVPAAMTLFTNEEFGCEDLGDMQSFYAPVLANLLSEGLCEGVESSLDDPENDILSARSEAWDLSDDQWPGHPLCQPLSGFVTLSRVLELMDESDSVERTVISSGCARHDLEDLRSHYQRVVGLAE